MSAYPWTRGGLLGLVPQPTYQSHALKKWHQRGATMPPIRGRRWRWRGTAKMSKAWAAFQTLRCGTGGYRVPYSVLRIVLVRYHLCLISCTKSSCKPIRVVCQSPEPFGLLSSSYRWKYEQVQQFWTTGKTTITQPSDGFRSADSRWTFLTITTRWGNLSGTGTLLERKGGSSTARGNGIQPCASLA